jgi:hypothetical protein
MAPYDSREWPRTVDEAVERLLSILSEDDRRTIAQASEDDLAGYHFGLGIAIRNQFGLWGGNQELLASCAADTGSPFIHPDGASAVIIWALWRRLQHAG